MILLLLLTTVLGASTPTASVQTDPLWHTYKMITGDVNKNSISVDIGLVNNAAKVREVHMRLNFYTSYKGDKQYQVGVLFKPTETAGAGAAHRLLGGTAAAAPEVKSNCTIDLNGIHWDGFLTSYNFTNATFDPHHVEFEIEDLFPEIPLTGFSTNTKGTKNDYLLRDCHNDWHVKNTSSIECVSDHCTYTIWAYRTAALHSNEDYDVTPAVI